MKQIIIKSICFLSSVAFLQGCSKEPDFDYPENEVGSSKIVYFASVEIKGERLIILNQGTPFTDPGVTASLNGEPVEAPSAVTVNVNVPGVYNLEYVAKNPEGFAASDWRTVVVISNSAQVANNDFSGTYLRDNGVSVIWKKTANGVYTVENPGGAAVGVGFFVTLVNYEGNKIAIPKQIAFDPSLPGPNTVNSTSESYSPGSPAEVKYAFIAGGYGTQVRNFTKL